MNIPKKYQERVAEVFHDEDGWWINLNDGWEIEEGSGLIHADTAKDALAQLRESYKINYEVVVVWNDGQKEIFGYETEEKAESIKAGMYKAFGNQLWAGVRKKA